MSEQSEFGLRLQEAREDAGYSREAVNALLGWAKNNNNLLRYEIHGRQPNEKSLIALCVLYDITPNYLYGFEWRYDGIEIIDDEYE